MRHVYARGTGGGGLNFSWQRSELCLPPIQGERSGSDGGWLDDPSNLTEGMLRAPQWRTYLQVRGTPRRESRAGGTPRHVPRATRGVACELHACTRRPGHAPGRRPWEIGSPPSNFCWISGGAAGQPRCGCPLAGVVRRLRQAHATRPPYPPNVPGAASSTRYSSTRKGLHRASHPLGTHLAALPCDRYCTPARCLGGWAAYRGKVSPFGSPLPPVSLPAECSLRSCFRVLPPGWSRTARPGRSTGLRATSSTR